jgi:hypothetical protein
VVPLRAGQADTPRLVIFSEVIIDLQSLNLTLDLFNVPKQFEHLHIVANYGAVAHTYFQTAFRALFDVLAAIAALAFFLKLRKTPTHAWHFEQKLTLPLIILVFFYNNPFYALEAYSPSRALVLLDTIFRDIFNAYFRFFILALFDCLRFKNRRITCGFYVPKIAIVVVLFLSSVIHGIYDDMARFGLPSVSEDNVEHHLRGTEVTLFIFYLIWAAASITRSGLTVDATERYKFGLYVAAGGTALGVLALVRVLFGEFAALRHSSLRFLAGYSIENGFVLLVTFFHWPTGLVVAKELGQSNAVADQDPELFVDGQEAA